MIWYYIILFVTSVLTAAFSWLPVVEVLPWGLDNILSDSVGYFKSFMVIFPPVATIFTAFMLYFAFRVTLLTLRLLRIIR